MGSMSISWSEFEPGAGERAEQASLAGSESQQLAQPDIVLIELCELLEAYGPFWYTEELRTRVFAAVRILLDNRYRESPQYQEWLVLSSRRAGSLARSCPPESFK